ncbi:hypothetical protein A1O3_04516 [Capronia epimyces CBS 606.96]|uniref:Chromo domain-containing protein n=1 Tax=Capronia epimyces CBS 606.96 TaxID=1182542 RepID=W9YE64_9EURO|nr:uncharacterized protein A1O3_04516 [Capronia epimyces CBS 606.96]EXJ87556.1 hypothetical protein A1O3_04516 [Capronia epimyces CBS 606.96]
MVVRNGIAYEEWGVLAILDSRQPDGDTLKYEVQWDGYPATWQVWWDVLPGCDRLVQEFHERYPDKPGPPADYDFES